MGHRPVNAGALVACLVTAWVGLSGCTGDDGAADLRDGCRPPANEKELLDEYRNEPVFKVAPRDARRAGEPTTSEACRELSREDTSSTAVTLRYTLSAGYSQRDLEDVFSRDVLSRGWRPVAAGGPSTAEVPHLYYCKRIRETTSLLYIGVHNRSVNPPADGSMTVSITASSEPCPAGPG